MVSNREAGRAGRGNGGTFEKVKTVLGEWVLLKTILTQLGIVKNVVGFTCWVVAFATVELPTYFPHSGDPARLARVWRLDHRPAGLPTGWFIIPNA